MKKTFSIISTFMLLFLVVLSLGVSPVFKTALKLANYDLSVIAEE